MGRAVRADNDGQAQVLRRIKQTFHQVTNLIKFLVRDHRVKRDLSDVTRKGAMFN